MQPKQRPSKGGEACPSAHQKPLEAISQQLLCTANPVCTIVDLPFPILTGIMALVEADQGLAQPCSAAAACRTLRHAVEEVLSGKASLHAQLLPRGPLSWAGVRPGLDVQGLAAVLPRCSSMQTLHLVGPADPHNIPQWEEDCMGNGLMLGTVLERCTWAGQGIMHVRIEHCPLLTSYVLFKAVTSLPQLRSLHLESCPLPEIAPSMAVMPSPPHLRDLSLRWCRPMNASMLLGASQQLTRLDITGCGSVNDELCSVGLPSIVHLNAAFTHISEEGLLMLAENSPKFEEVVLAKAADNLWDTGVTDFGIQRFKLSAPHVHVRLVSC